MRSWGLVHSVRGAILRIELLLACRAAFLRQIPVLRLLYRSITADLRVLEPEDGTAAGFRIDFRSPYFHLPVSIDRSQIGKIGTGRTLEPGAFRVFDWQTWAHIDGMVEWHGEQQGRGNGERFELIEGFSYRIPRLPEGVGNLGLRLAEGVEGEVRIACEGTIARVSFEPVFWLLETSAQGFRPAPIKTHKLMGLIVSLFDLGSENPTVAESAVERLCLWTKQNLGAETPFTSSRQLLQYIRDWGPIGLAPLYKGLRSVFEQLQVYNLELELFDFVADNWGIRSNPRGRILAVELLATLGSESARAALQAIYDLVKSGDIAEDELELIRSAVDRAGTADSHGLPASE